MSTQQYVEEMGTLLGIPSRPNDATIFGYKDGYPFQLSIVKDGRATNLVIIFRYDDSNKDSLLKDFIEQSSDIKQSGINKRQINIKGGILTLTFSKGILGFPKTSLVLDRVNVVAAVLKSICSSPGTLCRVCGKANPGDLLLLNGLVDRVCAGCLEKLDAAAREQELAYEQLKMNLPLAVIVGLVLAVVGAIGWAAVLILAQRMFWILAIGIGLMIGYGTTKAAGKGGVGLQVLIFILTVASVLMGLVFYSGYSLWQHAKASGLVVNWFEFFKLIPAILIGGKGDTVFSLVGGLIGAYYASRFARKPKIQVSVKR
jgi:hypothetical protein